MRRQPTRAEALLWQALRGRQLGGFKFGRQVPIGPFIADFFCFEAKLVVEVDGVTHDYSQADPYRDAWLRSRRLRVLRVQNEDVLSNLAGALELIRVAARCAEPLPLTPSHKGRGNS